MNLIVEAIESQQGKGPLAQYCTPGLFKRYDLGTAGVRGEITAQGRTFSVAGTVLWESLAPTASPNKVNRGAVISDGFPVSMASGPTQVLIASAGNVYVFDLVANTLTPDISGTVGGPVLQVGYSDGFFLALFKNSNKIQSSKALDATVWPGANATVVSVFTDNIVGFFIDHRELWVWGPKATQPYYNSGNFPFPFDVREGAFIESGMAAAFSPAKADNSIFWLEADDRGNCIVRRANGYTPERVSNHAIEYEFSTYSTVADAIAFSYKDQGHEFYQINFPTAEKSWAYDTATRMWGQRGFWNAQAGVFSRHRAQYHTFNFGMHLVGDPTTGAIYEMSINYLDDFGNPIRRVRRAPHLSREQERVRHHALQIDVETGLGPVPPLQGNDTATTFSLANANAVSWQVSVSDLGALETIQSTADTPSKVYLNDPLAKTSWQITVSTLGVLIPISVSYNASYPGAMPMVTQGGVNNYNLVIVDLGGGIAQFQTIPMGIVARGPQIMLRWSDDAGRSWSNEYALDCGQAGEYTKRVIRRRLGQTRDRIYEISMTDPIPWRIIDAYLFTDQDRAGEDRLVREMSKRA